jgi:hypothetical protein
VIVLFFTLVTTWFHWCDARNNRERVRQLVENQAGLEMRVAVMQEELRQYRCEYGAYRQSVGGHRREGTSTGSDTRLRSGYVQLE